MLKQDLSRILCGHHKLESMLENVHIAYLLFIRICPYVFKGKKLRFQVPIKL